MTACTPFVKDDDGYSEPIGSTRQALSQNWAASFREPYSYIEPLQVAIDGSRNVVIVGWFDSSANFGGSTLTTSSGPASYVAAFSSTGTHLWSRSIELVTVYAVATDSADNVIITGWMYDDTDFGGGTVANSSSVGSSMFLAKYDSSGNHVWSYSFGDGITAGGYELAVDSSDNVLVVGQYIGDLTIGSDSSSTSARSGFLAKFNSSGSPLFARFFESSSSSYKVYSEGIAVASNDSSIAVSGAFTGIVDFGDGPLTSSNGGTSSDTFVAKFDSAGNALWSSNYGPSRGQHVGADSSGNVIISGYFSGSLDFGSNTPTLTSSGTEATFVAKFDSNGTDVWSKSFPYARTWYHGLAISPSGDVLLAGRFRNSVNFGGGTLTSAGGSAPSGSDVFIAQWDATGAHITSARYGSAEYDIATSIAVDSVGDIVLFGGHEIGIDFGGEPLPNVADDTNELDLFLAHLTP